MNSDVTSFHLKIMGKVRLPNGGVYIKYYDEKNNKTVLIRKGTIGEEIHLIPIDQLDRYQYLISALSDEQRKIANLLISNIDKFNVPVEYINFENGIVIDEQNHVIGCVYDKKINNYVVKYINEMPTSLKSTSVVTNKNQLEITNNRNVKHKKNKKKNSVGMQILKASISGFALGFVLSVLFLVAKKFF